MNWIGDFQKAENEWPCHGRQGCDRESGQDYDLIAIVLYDKGTLRKGSSVASETEFELLDAYVKKKSLISGNRY